MMSGRSCSSSSRYPFTPSQWQELEHQALIYKYMVSGIPIPSDLILPLRRSFFLDSTAMTSPSLAFPPQPPMSWGCFQLGFGRKAEDPEPGRCRRTDGKKWRCSKEAYPDSKYCERHMHRGKNRSRKPVEMSLASALTTNQSSTTPNNCNALPLSISTPDTHYTHLQPQQHIMYPYSSPQKPQHNTPSSYFHLDNNTTSTPFSSADRDYNRYYQGMKDMDGYGFSSEGERGSFRPLGLSSFGEKEQQGVSAVQQSGYSFGRDENEEKQQHCFVLGADFKLERPVKHDDVQKPLRPFFDEWPQKSKDSWMGSDADHGSLDSYSKTQLSMSIPMAHHDFPIISSRYSTD